jgi:precorrin-3B C17-methyltransferase
MDKKKYTSTHKVYAVGIGPGDIELLTPCARKAIENSDVIVGYSLYLEQIKDLISTKEIYSSGMTKEIDRCRIALARAVEGKTVSVISSGDSGIYGMAGLLFELKESDVYAKVNIEVIPGITAASAAAAVLGAPLMSDYVSISLSDIMTPKEIILKRIQAVAESDLVCVLYNPKSKKRTELFSETIEIFTKYRSNVYVGIVKNASRENEEVIITAIKNIPYEKIDMTTLVVIGNSSTVYKNGKLYTPRGYKEKYRESFYV